MITASLTEYGHDLISRLIKDNISLADYFKTVCKFAVSDDGVVYGVYNPTLSLLKSVNVRNNVFENTYKLVTLYEIEGERRTFLPVILNVDVLYETQYPQKISIFPNTAYGNNNSYTLVIQPNIFTIVDEESDIDFYPQLGGSIFTAVGRRFVIRSKPFFSRKDEVNCVAYVLGNDEGGIFKFLIKVKRSELEIYSFRFPPRFVGIENIFIAISDYEASSEQDSSGNYIVNV